MALGDYKLYKMMMDPKASWSDVGAEALKEAGDAADETYDAAAAEASAAYDVAADAAGAAYDEIAETAGEAYDAVAEVASKVQKAASEKVASLFVPKDKQVVPAPGPMPLASTYADNSNSPDVQGANLVAESKAQPKSIFSWSDLYNDPFGALEGTLLSNVPDFLLPYLPGESESEVVAAAEPSIVDSIVEGIKHYFGYGAETISPTEPNTQSLAEASNEAAGAAPVAAARETAPVQKESPVALAQSNSARILYQPIDQPWYAPIETPIDDVVTTSYSNASSTSDLSAFSSDAVMYVESDFEPVSAPSLFVSTMPSTSTAETSTATAATISALESTAQPVIVAAAAVVSNTEPTQMLVHATDADSLYSADAQADTIYYRNVSHAAMASQAPIADDVSLNVNTGTLAQPSLMNGNEDVLPEASADFTATDLASSVELPTSGAQSIAVTSAGNASQSVGTVDRVSAGTETHSASVSVAAGHAALQAQQLAQKALEESQNVLRPDLRAVTIPLFPHVLGQGASLVADSKNRDQVVAELSRPLTSVQARADAQSGDSDQPGRQSEAAMAFDEIQRSASVQATMADATTDTDFGTFRPSTQDVFVFGAQA